MKREVIKEIKVGIRSGRFLILLASLLFYALLTPILLTTVLPKILASQFEGPEAEALLAALGTDQTAIMGSYVGDVYEIGTILVTFVLCGLIAQEIKENTLVLPLCAGSRFHHIIGSKALVYSIFLMAAAILSLLADYLYSGLLLSFDVDIALVFGGAGLMGLYLSYLVVCVMMWGAVVKSPVGAGFLTLGTTFGMHFVAGLFQKGNWVPSGLISAAADFSGKESGNLMAAIAVTLLMMGAMLAITQIRLRTLEWNGR